MGILIVQGATAGSHSPISPFGVIINGVLKLRDLPQSLGLLFVNPLVFNPLVATVMVFVFGGHRLLRRQTVPEEAARVGTASGNLTAGGGNESKEGTEKNEGVLDKIGTIDYMQGLIAGVGKPPFAALAASYVGGAISAFAATAAVLGASMPPAEPIIQQTSLSTTVIVTAIAISSTSVDTSSLSTNGALLLANAQNVGETRVLQAALAVGRSRYGPRAAARLVRIRRDRYSVISSILRWQGLSWGM